MSGVLLPICSIVFSLLLLFVYFAKKRVNLIENKVYSIMLICSFLDSILVSAAHSVAISGFAKSGLIFIQIFNKIDFCCLIIFSTCLLLYNLLINYKSLSERIKQIALSIFGFDLIFVILIFMTDLHVISREGAFSVEGPSVLINYCVCAILIALSIIVTIINIRHLTKRHIPMIITILLIIMLFFAFSFNPYLVVVSISLTFIDYIMYFTIENPDIKLINELELAKEQADKANRAKTDFLSSMSHEIRTPLNAINGFSNMIEESKTLEEAKANAKDIVSASDTLLEIVNGILDISKIESGKLEIIESPYNSREVFEELAKLITPRMKEKGLDFSYYIAPDLPDTLYGDHANIKKIVTNFLSNACKYTDKGFVHYEVNCINAHNKCKLVISVEDTGHGIKKEKIDKLFSKFDRLEVERNTTVEGTGLGLAITKQLVELMGGKIIVHTIYGEGSKFTVMLDQKVEKTKVVEKKERHKDVDLTSTKILLVDDNNLNLKVATKMLEKYGAKDITPAHSGFECLDLVKDNDYDIILLDDMMPKMSGTETLAELRKDPSFKTPVVALTANAISGMRERYLEQGFDEYLAKPIEQNEFIKVLDKLLDDDNDEEEVNVVVEPSTEDEPKEEKEEMEEEVEEPKEEQEVVIVEENNSIEEPPEIDNETFLRNHGVDMDKALEALGDMEMYNETFKDFEQELESKWSKLEQEKLSGDMENFAIDVHALKSDCKYLGFYNLADVAYEHELKSKENDKDFVDQNFNRLEAEYEKVLNIVKEYKDRI